LHAVAPAVPARGPKPVLTNVLLSNGTLTGTDLEIRISTPIDYAGPALLLPHARLTQIVGSLPADSEVSLKADGTSCVVKAGHGTWRLPVEDANEFPAANEVDASPIARLPADQFTALMGSVRFATDNESSRYALGGVLVQFKGGMISFVGTDGRRMCVAEAEIDQATDDTTVIVPRRVVDVLCRLAHGADAVQLEATANEILADVDGVSVRAALVQGKFPAWEKVEPTRTVKASLVVVGELLAACRQAAICTSEQSKGVTFAVTAEGLHLTSRSSEAGEASCTCDLVEPGDPCVVSLDPVFVVQWLGCGSFDNAETIELEAADAQSAVVLRAQDCRCVVMPLAVEG
jgi:DNA polymerase-3 subunit beta